MNSHFAPLARLLHWLMAVLLLAMLFIGAGMVALVSERHEWLLHLHKPLGIALLALVVIRLLVRFSTRQPPLPADLPPVPAPAAGDPVMLGSSLQLPSIVPASAQLFAFLRKAHGYLAYLLFLTVLVHLAAALFHGLIRRDGVLQSMLRGPRS